MQILVQNFNSGKVQLIDTVCPSLEMQQILVRTHASLISAGTDRAVLALGKKNPLAKALARPDLFRKVWQKLRRDGILATIRTVRSAVTQPKPLGYSLVGEVIALGPGITEFTLGQRVACAGQGFANHAEVVAVPKNLCVAVPDNISAETACYVTLGAIAMHGLRQAHVVAGNTVMVVGLGLLGQLSLQLVKAAGMQVIGIDIAPEKLAFTRAQGFCALSPHDVNLAATIAHLTHGEGVDAVLITAGSPSDSTIFSWLIPWCRDRAHVVVVGDVKMSMSRRDYFKKEITIWQSRSYGPGRYDPNYEIAGHDYPIAAVRWTENRNMQAFLQLLANDQITVDALTTHYFSLAEFQTAYRYVMSNGTDFYLGIVLTYDPQKPLVTRLTCHLEHNAHKITLGVIGTGNFARTILLPQFLKTKGFQIWGVASKTGLSASDVATTYGASYATAHAIDIISDSSIQAVSIATRHDSHAHYVKLALQAGKHVFVEKPLCITLTELREIEQLARESSGILQVGLNRRFSPAIQAIRQYFTDTGPKQLLYRINAGRIPLKSEAAWLHEAGGRLLGEACHFVDTMIAVTGALPIAVECQASAPGRLDLSAQDNVVFTIIFADGSVGTIHYHTNANATLPKEYFEVHSCEKSAYLDNYQRLVLQCGHRKRLQRYWGIAKGFQPQAQAFLRACQTGQSPIPLVELIATHEVLLLALNEINNPQQQILTRAT